MKVISSVFCFFNNFSKDHSFRSLIIKPFKKSLKAFFILLILVIALSYASCEYASSYMALGTGSYIALILGYFFVLIFVPPILTFLYFSFFCEEEYRNISLYSLSQIPEEVRLDVKSSKSVAFFSSTVRIVIMTSLLILSLIISLFLPFLGLVLTGFILVWDFFSYSASEMGLSFLKESSFFFSNFLSVLILSIVFGFLCLVPFLILFIYPLGVSICADLMKKDYEVRN
jgi:hypothetical protein